MSRVKTNDGQEFYKYLGGSFIRVGDFLEVDNKVYQVQRSKIMKNKIIFKRSSFIEYIRQQKELRED
ncbi:hypothetical protein LCGC14_2980230 [marine sediment metagenome]|uniref:Uncharacterized protein n=1 Tax=marine sediment metagenome TaxID=412755 RepID=A0A0F8X6S9_9ZZZZ|nr:hypothetical protein [bacterium]